MKKLLFLPLLFWFFSTIAQTNYKSASNGDWDKASTWQGAIAPTNINAGDSVIILHDVKVKANITVNGVMKVTSNGKLNNPNKYISGTGNFIFDGEVTMYQFQLKGSGNLITNNKLNGTSSFDLLDNSTTVFNGESTLNGITLNNNSSLTTNGNFKVTNSFYTLSNSSFVSNQTCDFNYLYVWENSSFLSKATLAVSQNMIVKNSASFVSENLISANNLFVEGGKFVALGSLDVGNEFRYSGGDSLAVYGQIKTGSHLSISNGSAFFFGGIETGKKIFVDNYAKVNFIGNNLIHVKSDYFLIRKGHVSIQGPIRVDHLLQTENNSTLVYSDSLYVKNGIFVNGNSKITGIGNKGSFLQGDVRVYGTSVLKISGSTVMEKSLYPHNYSLAIFENNLIAKSISPFDSSYIEINGNVTTQEDIILRNTSSMKINGNVDTRGLNLSGSNAMEILGNVNASNWLQASNNSILNVSGEINAKQIRFYGKEFFVGGNINTNEHVYVANLDTFNVNGNINSQGVISISKSPTYVNGSLYAKNDLTLIQTSSVFINGNIQTDKDLQFNAVNAIVSGNITTREKLRLYVNADVKILGNNKNYIGKEAIVNPGNLDIKGALVIDKSFTTYNSTVTYYDSLVVDDDIVFSNTLVNSNSSKAIITNKSLKILNNSTFATNGYLEVGKDLIIDLNQPNEIVFGGEVLIEGEVTLRNRTFLTIGPNANVYVNDRLTHYGDSIKQEGLLTVLDDYRNNGTSKHILASSAKAKFDKLELSGNVFTNNGVLIIENGGKVYGGGVIDGSGVLQVDGGLQIWGTVGGNQDVCSGDGITDPVTRGALSGSATVCSNPANFQQTGPAPLPVDLLTFDAEVNDDNIVELFWVTASEINNDYFTLYKAQENDEFVNFVTIPGAGTTNIKKVYEATDDECSGICYYKLSQTDFDGKKTEFDPISVIIENEGLNINEVKLYPNPLVGNTVYLQIPVSNDSDIELFINDLLGKQYIGDITFISMGDYSLIILEFSQKLPKGVYLISLIVNKEIISKKLYVD